MIVNINLHNDYWIASIVVKSGNRYTYSCTLYSEPTEEQVKALWRENRKHWRRIK